MCLTRECETHRAFFANLAIIRVSIHISKRFWPSPIAAVCPCVIRWWRRLFVPLEWRNTRNDFKTNCRVSDFSNTNRAQISNNFEIINLILLIVFSLILSESARLWLVLFLSNLKAQDAAKRFIYWHDLLERCDYSSLNTSIRVFLPIS